MEQVQCILKECARAWGVTRDDICGDSRKQNIVQARFAAAYMMVQSGMTLAETGLELGGRDHSTISHAISMVIGQMRGDLHYKVKIERILSACTLTAGSYVPSIGLVTPEQAYQLMRNHLALLDSMRAQTLHAMSLLPEPAPQDIPPVMEWRLPAYPGFTLPEVPAVGESYMRFRSQDDLPLNTIITMDERQFVIHSKEPLTSGLFEYQAKEVPCFPDYDAAGRDLDAKLEEEGVEI